MPETTKSKRYDIECFHCKMQFPIVVEVDTTSTVESSKELHCPFCNTFLQIKFSHAVKPTDILLRSIAPPEK